AAGPEVESGRGLELSNQIEDRGADASDARPVAAGHRTGRDPALEVRLPGEHRGDVAREARLDVDLVQAGVAQAGRVGRAVERAAHAHRDADVDLLEVGRGR